jgi:pyruvate kinase
MGVDLVALSFVRSADDIASARAFLATQGADVPLMAKIEKPEAVDVLDEILAVVDAVMVARGDLGVELSPAEVPLIQKDVIAKSIQAARPVITATQMLRSMVDSPHPTRAEAADVANAVLDSSDAVMLSEERPLVTILCRRCRCWHASPRRPKNACCHNVRRPCRLPMPI